MQGYPLFTSMNEIEHISKIAEVLGSPDVENWKGIEQMPDFGKISFKYQEPIDLGTVLTNQLKIEIEFLQCLIKYEGRLSS